MKEETLKQILDISDFDPLSVDISYIKQVSLMLPTDGSVDLNQAERLATIFLRCSDFCGELLAKLDLYKGHQDAAMKAAKSVAIASKIQNEKMTQTLAREAFYNDPTYMQAVSKLNQADAAYQWFEQKYNSLLKAHVLCKDIFKLHKRNEQQSGWQGGDPITLSEHQEHQEHQEQQETKKIGEIDWH